MGNIEVNIGGFIGAFIALGVGITVLTIQFGENIDDMGRGPAKLVIFGVIGGAIAGNFVWAKFVSKKNSERSESDSEQKK